MSDDESGPRFVCDAMLRGVARWLRAAGYDASWHYGIEDGELVRLARAEDRILLTSDGGIMDRKAIRSGAIRGLFIERDLDPLSATRHVLRTLGLGLRTSHCMACGGALQAVDKDAVQEEIPPRTLRWQDSYFRCTRCRKLFWRGTHWERIERGLRRLAE